MAETGSRQSPDGLSNTLPSGQDGRQPLKPCVSPGGQAAPLGGGVTIVATPARQANMAAPIVTAIATLRKVMQAYASIRLNSRFRYISTHDARRILPLVVIGIEPGATITRSATLKPCDVEIAEVTASFTPSMVSARFTRGSRGSLISTIATSVSS